MDFRYVNVYFLGIPESKTRIIHIFLGQVIPITTWGLMNSGGFMAV